MRRPCSSFLLASLFFSGLLCGCQPARPYDPRPAQVHATERDGKPAVEKPLPEDYAWLDTDRTRRDTDLPIEYIDPRSKPEEWKTLKAYWNDPGLVKPGEKRGAVRLKVPLGLANPQASIPPANPPTRGKWELGRRLFFDPGWLTDTKETSCATCHRPERAFTDGKAQADGYNTPTLVNVVYAPRLFWDGRARYLEEVVQARLEDERPGKEVTGFRHAWPGVIRRLRANRGYLEHFHQVFGIVPTQDTVGRAVATYLRTLLAGHSLHDRAIVEQQRQGARGLEASHYEAVLDDTAMKAFGGTGDRKAMAAKLVRGYTLFQGKAGCASCHPAGGTFSDGQFANIGTSTGDPETGGKPGRFATAPLGERNRSLKGAFKTPTLRTLLRTAPYFHNGQEADLAAAVRLHVRPEKKEAPINRFLDPRLATPEGVRRPFDLNDADIEAIVLFLHALNGEEVDDFVRTNPGEPRTQ